MKKNKFIEATLILMIGGLITKALGFIIKILYTRAIGSEGIALYTLVMPTYSLLLSIASLGMPLAISKMVAEKKERSFKILSQALIILLLINIILILIMILGSNFISDVLLHEKRVGVLLIGCSLTLPFVSITSILKGYFYGKQKMVPNNFSNVIEQTIKILFIIFILPDFLEKGLIQGILSFILLSIITEITSFIVFMFFLDKHVKINLREIKYNHKISKDLLSISIPTVAARFVGNIGFFFEPILLSYLMVRSGFSSETFVREYGIYNGYSISYLLLPSFFISALATSLVPEISNFYAKGDKIMVKRRLKQALVISFVFGSIVTFVMVYFRDILLNVIYDTNLGSDYIYWIGIFFIFYYLEAPLSSCLQSIGKANISFKITFYGVIIKLGIMGILAFLGLGVWSLVIAEIINIFFVVITSFKNVYKYVLA